MTITYLAIDPDIFRAAVQGDQRFSSALWDVWSNPKEEGAEEFVIIVDDNEIQVEYISILETRGDDGTHKILKEILNSIGNNTNRVREITPVTIPPVLLTKNCCITPVEPALVSIAATPGIPFVTIYLVGKDLRYLRPRALHRKTHKINLSRDIKRNFGKRFDVRYVIKPSIQRTKTMDHLKDSREFEKQTGLWFREFIDNELHDRDNRELGEEIISKCKYHWETPDGLAKYKCQVGKEAGTIDFWIDSSVDGIRTVWIGECQLHEEVNDFTFTNLDKVQQLQRKMEAFEVIEKRLFQREIVVKGYLLSNGCGLKPNALSFAQDQGIRYIHVHMPAGWTDNPNWKIHKSDFYRIDYRNGKKIPLSSSDLF